MLFAEADVSGNVVVITLGALAGLVTVCATAYKAWRKVKDDSNRVQHAIKMESDAASLSHFESVIRFLQGELVRGQADRERAAAHVGELQGAFDEIREEHATCRVQLAELFGTTARLYDDAARRLREAGRPAAYVEAELGPRPRMPDGAPDPAAIETRARELAQSSQALQAQARQAGEPLSGAGGPP